MQCKKCSTEIKEGNLFCHNCGEAVQIVPDYEPEFDDLQIEPMKEKEELPVDIKDGETDSPKQETATDSKTRGENKEKSSHKNWKWIAWGVVVCLSIVAFLISYRAVLKNQEPGAMLDTEISEEVTVSPNVAKPQFDISGGEYSYYISVQITSESNGNIYYTLDGSVPDETSEVYEKPIELSEGTTVIRAFVVDEEGNCSDVISEVYTIEFGAPDAPVIFPEAGNYEGEHYIRIIVPEGCLAYYTLDGATPTESSEVYSGEFLMPSGTTNVRVVLVDEKGNVSEISSVTYNCNNFTAE